MKWTLVAGIFLLAMVAGAIAPADATISLGFVPSSQTVTVGNPFTVDLAISGLGSGCGYLSASHGGWYDFFGGRHHLPGIRFLLADGPSQQSRDRGGAPSLGTFDFDVTFNPAILDFTSVVFGDPILGDQLGLKLASISSTTMPSAGFVNLFELSLDDIRVLNALQASSFVLARLTFDPLSEGTSLLGFSNIVLGDAYGDPLTVGRLGTGRVDVAPVPEPATILLLSSGLAGLGVATWKRRRRR